MRHAPAGLAGNSCTSRQAHVQHLAGSNCQRGLTLPPPLAQRTAARHGLVAASAATVGKDPVPAIVSYTVQKGETLWDVAVQHGVSMRTVKELNKLTGREPALTEGQQLLVPASGVTTLPAPEGAPVVPPAEALGSTPARGLWVGSEHVRLATVADAKQLYLRQCDRANPHNTLLVLYAPWCPHCRDMEDELERLAEGLSHVPSVRIVAVNGDSTEGRVFSREVLGVAYYPSIVSFPASSRTFYKYKGRARDAEALLRFFNMTCCAREDAMWGLRPAGARAGAAMAGPGQLLPFGLAPGPLAIAVGVAAVAALAAALLAARGRAGGAAGAGGGGVEAGVVAELDTSLGRMATLFVRALGTRLALAFGLVQAPTPALAAAAGSGGQDAGTAAPGAAAAAAPGPGQDAASTGAAAATSAAPRAPPQPTFAPSALPPAAASGSNNVVPAPSGQAPAAAASPVGSRELTAEERQRLTRLTDDELIALVNSDPDLDKVLSRLLGDK